MTSTAAVEEARGILTAVARRRGTIYYKDLSLQIKSERIHWRGWKLGDLLGRLSEDEWRAGRGFLSAVAVLGGGGIPSDGFFGMAEDALGRRITDRRSFWEAARDEVYAAHALSRGENT